MIGSLFILVALFCANNAIGTTTQTAISTLRSGRSAVIVGGGPTGLAASLMLEKCGWDDITIIEKRSINFFESTKAYLYLIDGRGQKCTDLLGLTKTVAANGVSSFLSSGFNEILPTGVIKSKPVPQFDTKSNEKFWIPRSEFLNCFLGDITKSKKIKILYSSSCSNIDIDDDGKVCVTIESENDRSEVRKIRPDFVLGCDGANSVVRSWLSTKEKKGENKFSTVTIPSDAAGLRYKMLTLKNRFPLPEVDSSEVNKNKAGTEIFPATANGKKPATLSTPEEKYVFRSIGKTQNTRINLGLLSVKGDAPRTANIICVPEHEIWKLKTFDEVKKFLVKSFPQINFSTFVSDEEIARFASSVPGVFPKPQYVKGLQQIFNYKNNGEIKSQSGQMSHPTSIAVCGVALAGDAVHAFPPDLGQGVNVGLEDVFELHNELIKSGNNIETALPRYETSRQPEAEALCKIMKFGYPYQYNQAPRKQKLCLANFAFRIAINKLLPFMFSPPACFLVTKYPDMKYKEILRRAHNTTRNIFLSFAVVFFTIFAKVMKVPFNFNFLPVPL